jgi:hypothetical protein
MIFVMKTGKLEFGLKLCKTKVFASGGNGSEDLLAKRLIAFILGKVKF